MDTGSFYQPWSLPPVQLPELSPQHPLSQQQWQLVRQLLKDLDDRQALWLSGFLAGQRGDPAPATPTQGAASMLIAYGTETGNCRGLAKRLAERCAAQGIQVDVKDLERMRPRQLSKYSVLALITATHGDGDPPEPIHSFYEAIMADDAPSLGGLRFAVLGLGDSSYEHFCVTGRELDARFEALGAERLLQRCDCDVDFSAPAEQWMTALLPLLPRDTTQSTATVAGHDARDSAVGDKTFSKDSPALAEVLVNHNLSHLSRSEPIHHLELACDVNALGLAPGDAIGILPENPPELIAAILTLVHLSGEEAVSINGNAMPLVQALREHRDLTIAGARMLETWAPLSGHDDLLALIGEQKQQQREFLRNHQLRDIFRRYPAHPEAQQLVDCLRPQQPRLYDVANNPLADDEELHLTVKDYRYSFNGRNERGIASAYLLGLQPGDAVRMYPHRNQRFHLPDADNAPLILIADSTGIAPYRAFLQALTERGANTPCWLVFSEQRFEDDFLYQLDLQQAREDGALHHFDGVFYCDHPGRTLADAVLDNLPRLENWLGDGAHVYLCGDKPLLGECESALQSKLDARRGEHYWQQLVKSKRVHRNLY